MTIQELIESERAGLQQLRAVKNRHPNDAATQSLIADAALEAAERISRLQELLHYKEEKPGDSANGGE